MNKQQKRLLNFVRNLNLNILIFEELEDRDSQMVNFINSFTLNYIVSKLNWKNKQEFINLLEYETNNDKIWQFVKMHIENFEGNFAKELENKLRKIKMQALNIN